MKLIGELIYIVCFLLLFHLLPKFGITSDLKSQIGEYWIPIEFLAITLPLSFVLTTSSEGAGIGLVGGILFYGGKELIKYRFTDLLFCWSSLIIPTLCMVFVFGAIGARNRNILSESYLGGWGMIMVLFAIAMALLVLLVYHFSILPNLECQTEFTQIWIGEHRIL